MSSLTLKICDTLDLAARSQLFGKKNVAANYAPSTTLYTTENWPQNYPLLILPRSTTARAPAAGIYCYSWGLL